MNARFEHHPFLFILRVACILLFFSPVTKAIANKQCVKIINGIKEIPVTMQFEVGFYALSADLGVKILS